MQSLDYRDVSIPQHRWEPGIGDVFNLSSHIRARQAIDLALSIIGPDFNVILIGDENVGRMTATVDYLRYRRPIEHLVRQDWLYLQNFWVEHEPRAFGVNPGEGRRFEEHLTHYVKRVFTMLKAALDSETHRARLEEIYRDAERELDGKQRQLRRGSERNGSARRGAARKLEATLRLSQADEDPEARATSRGLFENPTEFEEEAGKIKAAAEYAATELDRKTLEAIIMKERAAFSDQFAQYQDLCNWIDDLNTDMLSNVTTIARLVRDGSVDVPVRYRANLLIDQTDNDGVPVILEPNPTYENLFGAIEYRRQQGSFETDFSLIRPGALHRANGGILVLRAESLAKDDSVVDALKAALRDGMIAIEERHRMGSMPVANTPRPQPIPLSLKIIVISSPGTFYQHFSDDTEFRAHFKIRAEIDPDMPATLENAATLAAILQRTIMRHGMQYTTDAVDCLLGLSSKIAGRRDILSARFELLDDLIREAQRLAEPSKALSREEILLAWNARRHRNRRAEERFLESIARRHIAISTEGTAIGQVNALTVREVGDYAFGRPSRVSARASIGRKGVVNIEHVTQLSGRSQQKGAMVVEGYLRGQFGRLRPLSFDCSITFEQNYGRIEGDSASVAEFVAIISAVCGMPIRQDLAVTGSFNQLGDVQAVGDVTEKVEGFYEATEGNRRKGLLSGVILPSANIGDLVLAEEVAEALAQGRFKIWAIDRVEEAVAIFAAPPGADLSNRNAQDLTRQAAAIYARMDGNLAQFSETQRLYDSRPPQR